LNWIFVLGIANATGTASYRSLTAAFWPSLFFEVLIFFVTAFDNF